MNAPTVDLQPLLAESAGVLADKPLWLCDVALDAAENYLFEGGDWRELIGAGRRLMAIRNLWSKAMPAGSLLLRVESDRAVAIIPPQTDQRWRMALTKSVATALGGSVQLPMGVVKLTGQQLFDGLYRSPNRVIGIPGMTDHQSRINRYYMVENPSTLPAPDKIAARRHFGEVTALALTARQRFAEDDQPPVYYECLPVCIRCSACQTRPAEIGADPNTPLCAICAYKRQAVTDTLSTGPNVLIGVQLPGVERLFLDQVTPDAYKRISLTLEDTWRKALNDAKKAGPITVIWQSSAAAWLMASPSMALPATARLLSAFESNLAAFSMGKPITSAVIFITDDKFDLPQWYELAEITLRRTIQVANRDRDNSPGTIRVITASTNVSAPTENDSLRYTAESLGHLHDAAHKVTTAGFPIGLFSTILAQGTTQAAHLIYEQTRTRLTVLQRPILDDVVRDFERLWGVGSLRFFQALREMQSVADGQALEQSKRGET